MKKLLSLLSVLTISGAAVPTTIAASPYQKEESLNSNINLQTNNLKNLNRNKRENNVFGFEKEDILNLNEDGYFNFLVSIGKPPIINFLNNKIYVVSKNIFLGKNNKFNNKIYEYDPEKQQSKIILETDTDSNIEPIVFCLNENFYFISKNNLYEYNANTKQQKIIIEEKNISNSGLLYLGGKLYIISSPYTSLCKIHEFNPINKEHKEFNINIGRYSYINKDIVTINNRIYFSTGSGKDDLNIYEFNPTTGQQKIIISDRNCYLSSYGVIINNKLYFSTDNSYDGKIYEYDQEKQQSKIITTIDEKITYSNFIELNNKIYFSTNSGNIYEYDPIIKKYKIIINNNLICSPVFIFNKNLYVFSTNKIFKYDSLKLIKSDIINLEEIVKNGIYLYYKKQNYNSQIRNISNIDLNNLSFLETKAIKILSKPKQKILLPFYNYHEEKQNILEKEITYNSPEDEISEEISKSIEIKKGLSTTSGKTKSQTITNSHNFNMGLSVSGEVETKIFGIGANITTTINTEYGYSNENSGSTEVILENSFNSSNTRKEEKKEINKKTIKSQSIIIPSGKKLIYNNSKIYKYNCEDVWNLTKKISGLISALIVNENNNSEILNVSIKDVMQSLKENNILSEEFKINKQDNSITWTGKMVTKYTCGFEQDSSSETKLVNL